MQEIRIYSKNYCAYCHRAIELLNIKGVRYKNVDITSDHALELEMQHRSGQTTVPQIFIGTQHIGGCDELFALDEQGLLDPLLAQLES